MFGKLGRNIDGKSFPYKNASSLFSADIEKKIIWKHIFNNVWINQARISDPTSTDNALFIYATSAINVWIFNGERLFGPDINNKNCIHSVGNWIQQEYSGPTSIDTALAHLYKNANSLISELRIFGYGPDMKRDLKLYSLENL